MRDGDTGRVELLLSSKVTTTNTHSHGHICSNTHTNKQFHNKGFSTLPVKRFFPVRSNSEEGLLLNGLVSGTGVGGLVVVGGGRVVESNNSSKKMNAHTRTHSYRANAWAPHTVSISL